MQQELGRHAAPSGGDEGEVEGFADDQTLKADERLCDAWVEKCRNLLTSEHPSTVLRLGEEPSAKGAAAWRRRGHRHGGRRRVIGIG